MSTAFDKHICLFDPAIKWGDNATDRDTWPVTRDPSGLVLHEGKKATVFHAAKLTFSQYAWCKEAGSETDVCGRAFRVGVRRVDFPDGQSWAPVGVDTKDFFACAMAELEPFANVVVEEIGALIMQSGKLPFGLLGSYMVRPSSLHAWDAHQRALRCVELNAERAIRRQQKRDLTP